MWTKEAPSPYRRISPEEKFDFSCHRGLPCYATCCGDVNIFLTPYDVLRMKKALGLSSSEFLIRYTIPRLGGRGLPLVMLKMREDEKRLCPFVIEDGCGIYDNRPWSCRMFPLTTRVSETEGERYFIIDDPSCLGLREKRSWTIEEYKKDQGIEPYDVMDKAYREITYHECFRRRKGLELREAKMFYQVCYDLNGFKNFLFKGRFFDIYDVEPEVIKRMEEDEEELLRFGFRYLRFIFFWEDTLRFKDSSMAALWGLRRKQELGLL